MGGFGQQIILLCQELGSETETSLVSSGDQGGAALSRPAPHLNES